MRSFWLSLLAFVLLMCGCKSKNLSKSVGLESHISSETAYMNSNERIDTTKTAYSEQVSEFKLLYETITETIYDTDKNVAKKVTETKRTFVQDTQTDIGEEEQRRLNVVANDGLNHIADVSKKVESETKEESKGGQEAFGRWVGIVIGCVIGLLIIYLLRKLRIN